MDSPTGFSRNRLSMVDFSPNLCSNLYTYTNWIRGYKTVRFSSYLFLFLILKTGRVFPRNINNSSNFVKVKIQVLWKLHSNYVIILFLSSCFTILGKWPLIIMNCLNSVKRPVIRVAFNNRTELSYLKLKFSFVKKKFF